MKQPEVKASVVKKHVYRVGDKVRILRPNWIARVGYPLIWTDLIDEVEADPRTAAAMTALGFGGFEPNFFNQKPKFDKEFVRAVAMLRVRQRGFGGKERQLIYEKPMDPAMSTVCTAVAHGMFKMYTTGDYTGFGMNVISKRTVKTGTYYPPSGGRTYGYNGEEDWYEPGGLLDAKTHVLLTLDRGEISTADVEPW